jgi:hypothetical protein
MSPHTMIHLHHVNLFSRDLTAAIAWYKRALGAEVCYDVDFAGSRNVFMKIGSGRIHLYSQAPRDNGRGAVHHIGIRTTDLASLHSRLIEMGVMFRGGFGSSVHGAISCARRPTTFSSSFSRSLLRQCLRSWLATSATIPADRKRRSMLRSTGWARAIKRTNLCPQGRVHPIREA